MIRYARWIFATLAWVFVAAIVFQVFLIGLGLFSDPSYQQTHRDFGFTGVGLASLALLISAIVARPGRRLLGLVVLLFVLYIVQSSLPGMKTSYPVVAALHPVNALLLFGIAFYVARVATVLARANALSPVGTSSQPGTPT